MVTGITQLASREVAKPWGVAVPLDTDSQRKIGEVWYDTHAPFEGLLVKKILTSERLSVQVHPSDEHCMRYKLDAKGKEECWFILDTEPEAQIGVGFREEITKERLVQAAKDGSIEHLLDWRTVFPGDFFYVPAGTVHAIGAGITLLEVQQNSDTTYRLYDYGRGRELHLREASLVSDLSGTSPQDFHQTSGHDFCELTSGPYFRMAYASAASQVGVSWHGFEPLLVCPLTDGGVAQGTELSSGSCYQTDRFDLLRWSDEVPVLLIGSVRG